MSYSSYGLGKFLPRTARKSIENSLSMGFLKVSDSLDEVQHTLHELEEKVRSVFGDEVTF